MAVSTHSATISPEREAQILASEPRGLLIDGKWQDACDGGTYIVHDPATGQLLATLVSATSQSVHAYQSRRGTSRWKWPPRHRRP